MNPPARSCCDARASASARYRTAYERQNGAGWFRGANRLQLSELVTAQEPLERLAVDLRDRRRLVEIAVGRAQQIAEVRAFVLGTRGTQRDLLVDRLLDRARQLLRVTGLREDH